MNIVIPMAGLGSRFQNAGVTTPKPLIVVNGKTLIEHSVDSIGIDGKYIFYSPLVSLNSAMFSFTNVAMSVFILSAG